MISKWIQMLWKVVEELLFKRLELLCKKMKKSHLKR